MLVTPKSAQTQVRLNRRLDGSLAEVSHGGLPGGSRANWRDWDYGSRSQSQWEDPHREEPCPDLLPSFVQGWFVLQDSGLDAQEKNMVLAALKSDFSVEKVCQELRNQWVDDDLRDSSGRGAAWFSSTASDDSDDDLAEPDLGLLVGENEAQDASVMLERGRRTLREAREKQHKVKMSRQYFKFNKSSKSFGSPRPETGHARGTSSGGSHVACLSCGGSHRTPECPHKPTSSSASRATIKEEAPFICFSENQDAEACGWGLTSLRLRPCDKGKP